MTVTVQTRHPDYNKNMHKWALVRDISDGDVLKYLRNVGASESAEKEQKERQTAYEEGAYLLNFLSRTVSGMIGGVYRKPVEIEFPTHLEYLKTNVDGNNQGIVQQSQEVLRDVLETGRDGLFVDAPASSETNLKADLDGKNDPRIIPYKAESIINWRTKSNGSVNVLAMVVLAEVYVYQEAANEFEDLLGMQYRVLDFDENNFYRQRVFKFDTKNESTGKIELFEPKANGQRMTEIPFVFVGSENNTFTVDEAPAYPLALINKAHYRNTADNEEQLFVISQAMLVVSPNEHTKNEDWKVWNPNGVKYGSRSGLLVPGGSAQLLQASPNNMLSDAITKKEDQAVAMGAQLISPTKVITAESARLQRGADTSVLANVANNVSEAYTRAIGWCDMFKGSDSEFTFKLNTDFFLAMLTAQDRAQWAADITSSVLPATLYYKRLRQSGDVPEEWTDDEIKEAIEPREWLID